MILGDLLVAWRGPNIAAVAVGRMQRGQPTSHSASWKPCRVRQFTMLDQQEFDMKHLFYTVVLLALPLVFAQACGAGGSNTVTVSGGTASANAPSGTAIASGGAATAVVSAGAGTASVSPSVSASVPIMPQ